jgi:hypothetical protein
MNKIIDMDIEATFADSKKKRGIEKYAEITQAFPLVNVTTDKNFQKRFNGFYRVRRNSDWQIVYYDIMEKGKNTNLSFEGVLRELYIKTGRIEASFASKLIHTLNNNMPIWDRFVLQNLNLKMPLCKGEQKIQAAIGIYHEIMQWYEKSLSTNEIDKKIFEFDEIFPEYRWFSKTKKLDFLLWQMRER